MKRIFLAFLLAILLLPGVGAAATCDATCKAQSFISGSCEAGGISGNNLAVTPDNWGLTYDGGTQIIHLDNSVLHNGDVSMRVDAFTDAYGTGNTYREIDGPVIYVKPGDHIVYSAWIKTGHSTLGNDGIPPPNGNGAAIGVDFYSGSQHDAFEHSSDDPAQYDPSCSFDTFNDAPQVYVPFNSDWTFRQLDFVIPATVPDCYHNKAQVVVTYIIPWLGAASYNNNRVQDEGRVWFADTGLYINPTSGTCQSGEMSIGQDSCSSGQLCCCASVQAVQTCTDGTPYSSCSSTKPLYCSSGTLVNKCSQCGCSSGTCQADGSCSSGGLVGYWKFDEGTGITAKDSSTYHNAGALYNSPAWVAGKSGSALQFNGVNQYVTANNIPVNTSAGAKNTVSFWMYWTGTDSQMLVMFPQSFYDIAFYQGCFGFNTGKGDIIGIPSSGLANTPVHVAAIFYNGAPSSSTVSLYINGVKQSVSSCNGVSPNSPSLSSTVEIGGGWSSNYYFGGIIDEVKVWNRALSAAEVLAEYGGGVQTCSDGTAYGSCSANKPLYCSSGTLINKCGTCGCSTGTCQSDGTCSGCGNGICETGETYANCPKDCCKSSCTATSDSVCHSGCNNYASCSGFQSLCNTKTLGTKICTDSYDYATCCNGAVTSCGVNSISCNSYCNGNSICTYPSNPATCSKTCSGGVCQSCTASCGSPRCTACGTGLTCSNNKCVQICGGRSNPCPNEEAPQIPANSSVWTVAVVLMTIAGLILGYFILKEEVMFAETAKTKKKRRKRG